MFKIEQRKNRKFNTFNDTEDIINMLKEQFSTRKLYVKYDDLKNEIYVNEYNEDNTVMLVTDPNFKPEKNFIIYGLSDKYVEIELEIIEEISPGYFKCSINDAKRAVDGRIDLRFKLSQGEVVATNFRVSKHTIEVSRFNIPTSIKVVLDQFQSANMKFADRFRVDVFAPDLKDAALKAIRNSGKNLFVSDLSDPETYKAENENFIDVAQIYRHDLGKLVKNNVEKGLKSMIIVPIIYITEDGNSVPFAYIQAISKDINFSIDKVIELQEMAIQLVDRIRDANTLYLAVHQHITDIGRGGAKLKITNSELKKHLQKSQGFVFDIVFKLQAPITIYGEIESVIIDQNGDIFVGVDFEGNSSRKDEIKRFHDVIKPMEAEYKSKLIKSMKNK